MMTNASQRFARVVMIQAIAAILPLVVPIGTPTFAVAAVGCDSQQARTAYTSGRFGNDFNDQGCTKPADLKLNRYYVPSRTFCIVHLPDGSVLTPAPEHLSEKDSIRVVVIAPSATTVDFADISCPLPDLNKAFGVAAKETTTKEEAREREEPLDTCTLHWSVPVLHCADALKYTLKVTAGTQTNTFPIAPIAIEPIYRFVFGAGFGYDFARRDDFASREQVVTDAGGATSTIKVITRDHDEAGLRPVITATIYPLGANPQYWTWSDALAPFVGLDPTKIDKGLVTGINVSPGAGIGLLLGASIFKTEKISSPSNAHVGDTIPTGATFDTRETFGKHSVGFFVGMNIPLATMDTFTKAVAKGFPPFGGATH